MLPHEQPRLVVGRDAREQRPRLRLAVDRADADLPRAAVAARVPAALDPLALDDLALLLRVGAQRGGELGVAAQLGELRQRAGRRTTTCAETRTDSVISVNTGEKSDQSPVAPTTYAPFGPRWDSWWACARLRCSHSDASPPSAHAIDSSKNSMSRSASPYSAAVSMSHRSRSFELPRSSRVHMSVMPYGIRPPASGCSLRRVADRLAHDLRLGPDERHHVLERVAERDLVAVVVLVVAALGEDVVPARLLVGDAGAEHVGVPLQLALRATCGRPRARRAAASRATRAGCPRAGRRPRASARRARGSARRARRRRRSAASRSRRARAGPGSGTRRASPPFVPVGTGSAVPLAEPVGRDRVRPRAPAAAEEARAASVSHPSTGARMAEAKMCSGSVSRPSGSWPTDSVFDPSS